jgi:hypothetical protein
MGWRQLSSDAKLLKPQTGVYTFVASFVTRRVTKEATKAKDRFE